MCTQSSVSRARPKPTVLRLYSRRGRKALVERAERSQSACVHMQTPGPSGFGDDHDLYPLLAAGWRRSAQPFGLVVLY